jgi:hypothetical protein
MYVKEIRKRTFGICLRVYHSQIMAELPGEAKENNGNEGTGKGRTMQQTVLQSTPFRAVIRSDIVIHERHQHLEERF